MTYEEYKCCPTCSECGEVITYDDYWEFDGKIICEECLKNHQDSVDHYIENKMSERMAYEEDYSYFDD